MGKYNYFKKGELDIHLSNGIIVVAPALINKGAKNYRFNCETNVLEKKCISCNEYYEVQKYKEGAFIDIHDENQIHYFSDTSGYQGKCKKCLKTDEFSENEQSPSILSENGLTEDNQNYIKMLSLFKGQPEKETLNLVVNIIRKHNKIEYNEVIT